MRSHLINGETPKKPAGIAPNKRWDLAINTETPKIKYRDPAKIKYRDLPKIQ